MAMAAMKRRRADPTAATQPDAAVPTASGTQSVPSTGAKPVAPRQKSSVAWWPVISVMALLVVVLVFILQNLKTVRVKFLTVDWRIPLAVDLLFAAVLGGLIVLAVISLRDIQRRRAVRRQARRGSNAPDAKA
jgi:uncharacterized integral membrane protein